MMAPPIGFGKLVDRLALAGDPHRSGEGLPERFAQAGMRIGAEQLRQLIEFGAGRPYATMAAARYAALNARKLDSDEVGWFETREGIAEAERHLAEDPNG